MRTHSHLVHGGLTLYLVSTALCNVLLPRDLSLVLRSPLNFGGTGGGGAHAAGAGSGSTSGGYRYSPANSGGTYRQPSVPNYRPPSTPSYHNSGGEREPDPQIPSGPDDSSSSDSYEDPYTSPVYNPGSYAAPTTSSFDFANAATSTNNFGFSSATSSMSNSFTAAATSGSSVDSSSSSVATPSPSTVDDNSAGTRPTTLGAGTWELLLTVFGLTTLLRTY